VQLYMMMLELNVKVRFFCSWKNTWLFSRFLVTNIYIIQVFR
jgi:hypothetical protein